jgi:hypothetical protein
MQIFILHENPLINAQMYVDRPVCKIQTESAQCLSTVFRFYSNENNIPVWLYKSTHEKHPCVLWLKESSDNFKYTIKLGLALHAEYNFRYPSNRKYKKERQHFVWFQKNIPAMPNQLLIDFAQAMPDKYKTKSVVDAYRNYYLHEKNHLFKWTNRLTPDWIQEGSTCSV